MQSLALASSFEGKTMKLALNRFFLVAVAVLPTVAQEASAADFYLTVSVGWHHVVFYQAVYCEASTFHTSAKRRRLNVEKIGCEVQEYNWSPNYIPYFARDEESDADYVDAVSWRLGVGSWVMQPAGCIRAKAYAIYKGEKVEKGPVELDCP